MSKKIFNILTVVTNKKNLKLMKLPTYFEYIMKHKHLKKQNFNL